MGKVSRCFRVPAVIAPWLCWEGDEVVGAASVLGASACIVWDCLQCHVVCVLPFGSDVVLLLT